MLSSQIGITSTDLHLNLLKTSDFLTIACDVVVKYLARLTTNAVRGSKIFLKFLSDDIGVIREDMGGDDVPFLNNHVLEVLSLRWGVLAVILRLLEWDRFRPLNDPVDLSKHRHDHKVLPVTTETLDHRGGFALLCHASSLYWP